MSNDIAQTDVAASSAELSLVAGFTEDDAKRCNPDLVTVLNELIDRSIARGAIWMARREGNELNLYTFNDVINPENNRAHQALSVACDRVWPLCRRILIKRAMAAGGCLYAETVKL